MPGDTQCWPGYVREICKWNNCSGTWRCSNLSMNQVTKWYNVWVKQPNLISFHIYIVTYTSCMYAYLAVFLSLRLPEWKKESAQSSWVQWRITEEKYLYSHIGLVDICSLIYLSLEDLHELSVPRTVQVSFWSDCCISLLSMALKQTVTFQKNPVSCYSPWGIKARRYSSILHCQKSQSHW